MALVEFWFKVNTGDRIWISAEVTEFAYSLQSANTTNDPDSVEIPVDLLHPDDLREIEQHAVDTYEDDKRSGVL